jgi:isoquinoline 1-oxidoreductase beta subunit
MADHTYKSDMDNNHKQKKKGKWTRRAFIGVGGLAGVGLLVAVGGNVYLNKKVKKYSGAGMGEGDSLNAWIRIAPDNTITVAVPRAEMGQGVYTSIPQMIAEELDVDMSTIKVIHPQPESPYSNTFMLTQKEPNAFKGYSLMEKIYASLPLIATGGSTTIPDGYNNMRYAGATAREMLKVAAADKWDIDVADCKAENGHIINTGNNEKLSYGQLAEAAAEVQYDGLPELKKKAEWKLIGKPVERLDIPDKVTGTAEFGLDVRLENMKYAVLKHPSVIGGKITDLINKDDIEARPGIEKVVLTKFGAAVIGDNTWRAKNAALALRVEEDDSGNGNINSATIDAELNEILEQTPLATPVNDGDVAAVFSDKNNTVIEGTYEVPYLAHAAMEPLNCTVLVNSDSAEAWVGHQGSSIVQNMVSEVAGLAKSAIKVNTTYLGGGFGRRAEPDFVRKATAVAKEMPGVPIQTVFTREEDMQNDMYRPAAKSRFKAVVDTNGEITAWDNMMALQSVSNSAISRMMPAMAPPPEKDEATIEGAANLPYIMKNQRVAFGNHDLPVQVGFWRSVGSSQNAFFTESFLDECAHAAGQDPYQFRKSKLANHPRFAAVLDKAAELGNWGAQDGKFRGIALHKSFGSIVGQVAQISKVGDKQFSIDRYSCVIDCGTYINPDTVQAQMEGGLVFGLSAALYGEITWDDGSVNELNFPQYDMVRMNVSPQVDVHIMENEHYPGGVGEPGTPPAAPALTNAIFAATGNRIRKLPIAKQGYTFV